MKPKTPPRPAQALSRHAVTPSQAPDDPQMPVDDLPSGVTPLEDEVSPLSAAMEAILGTLSERVFEPMNDQIVVQPLSAGQTVSRGGIVIPENAKKHTYRGVVLAVGKGFLTPEGKRIPMELARGDLIIYNAYAGFDIKLGNETFTMLTERDVFGRMVFAD